jgi:ATP-dependent Lon protease
VHFPAGAVKKDGPSAGLAVTCALVSLLSGRLARSDTAMTGEVTLRGHVLAVGGVRAKVATAYITPTSRNTRTVILPVHTLLVTLSLP